MPKSNIKYDKTSSVNSEVQPFSLKCRYITIADFDLDHLDDMLQVARSQYSWYAYIVHEPETVESGRHIHILLFSSSNIKLDKHIERFRGIVPPNFVRLVHSGRAMARYLCHLDNPEKIQYPTSQVITSNRDKYLSMINDSIHADSVSLWHDYLKLRHGELNPEEFLDMYRAELASMPMYQRFSMYQKIYDTCSFRFYHSASIGVRDNTSNSELNEGCPLPSPIEAFNINNNIGD